jgi:hypothetical protein
MPGFGKWAGRCLSVALLCAPSSAFAYCRAQSCELGEAARVDAGADECQRDAHECVTEGKPLHWAGPCLDYAVQEAGSPRTGLDAAAFQQAVADAFAAWEAAPCPGGGSPRFHAQFQGYVSCDRHEAVCGDASQNVNVMMFHDTAWPGTASEIGLTTPTGGVSSGLVVDADLELNSADFELSLGTARPGALNLSDVLAHEVGHFLGLGHSDVAGSLMFEDYTGVTLSPDLLTADDIAAICRVYPPGTPLECGEPAPPAYDTCQVVPGPQTECVLKSMTHDRDKSGCSLGAVRPSGNATLLSALLLGFALRRRRGRFTRCRAP